MFSSHVFYLKNDVDWLFNVLNNLEINTCTVKPVYTEPLYSETCLHWTSTVKPVYTEPLYSENCLQWNLSTLNLCTVKPVYTEPLYSETCL
jgi:hypothetical protein